MRIVFHRYNLGYRWRVVLLFLVKIKKNYLGLQGLRAKLLKLTTSFIIVIVIEAGRNAFTISGRESRMARLTLKICIVLTRLYVVIGRS